MISNEKQSRSWLKEQEWFSEDTENEDFENYQVNIIEYMTGIKLEETDFCIELNILKLKSIDYASGEVGKFSKIYEKNGKYYYFNLVFFSNQEDYDIGLFNLVKFIIAQIKLLNKFNSKTFNFINIIDGFSGYSKNKDWCDSCDSYLKNNVKTCFFIGDMNSFFKFNETM